MTERTVTGAAGGQSGGTSPAGSDRPDTAALLAEVEAAVAAKRREGLYPSAEVRRVEGAAVRMQPSIADGAQAEIASRHTALVEKWDAKECEVSTHRRGPAGALILGAKRLLHRLLRPFLNVALARQTEFNGELVKLLNALLPQHADLRLRLEQAECRIEELEEAARSAARPSQPAAGAGLSGRAEGA